VPQPGSFNLINNLTSEHYYIFKPVHGPAVYMPDFYKFEYNPYLEYGVSNEFSVGLSPSFQAVASEYFHAFDSGEDRNYAFAYSDVFLKGKIIQSAENGYALSIIPHIELPGIYDETSTPDLGKKEQFWALYFDLGKNTYNQLYNYGYIDIAAGFRARMEDSFSNDGGGAFILNAQTSLPIYRDLQINLGLNYTKNVASYAPNNTILSRYGYDATKLTISQIATYGGLAIEYGYIAQVDARNTGLGNGVKLSISNKF